MAKVLNTPEQVKAAAHEFVARAEAQQIEQKNVIENTLEEIKNINPELGGFEEIAALLTLEEEHFSLLAPLFLAELETSFNNVND